MSFAGSMHTKEGLDADGGEESVATGSLTSEAAASQIQTQEWQRATQRRKRDCEAMVEALEKENADLKLQLSKKNEALEKENADLKLQLAKKEKIILL